MYISSSTCPASLLATRTSYSISTSQWFSVRIVSALSSGNGMVVTIPCGSRVLWAMRNGVRWCYDGAVKPCRLYAFCHIALWNWARPWIRVLQISDSKVKYRNFSVIVGGAMKLMRVHSSLEERMLLMHNKKLVDFIFKSYLSWELLASKVIVLRLHGMQWYR